MMLYTHGLDFIKKTKLVEFYHISHSDTNGTGLAKITVMNFVTV
jgi:hypothetical protein